MISEKTVARYVVLVCFGQAARSGHSTEAHHEQSCMADNIANLGGLNPWVVTNDWIGWWLSTVMAITHPTCNMYLFYPFLSMLANVCKETSFLHHPASVICRQEIASNQNRTVFVGCIPPLMWFSKPARESGDLCLIMFAHICYSATPSVQPKHESNSAPPGRTSPLPPHRQLQRPFLQRNSWWSSLPSRARSCRAIPKANPKKPHDGLRMIESPKWMVGIPSITKCVFEPYLKMNIE